MKKTNHRGTEDTEGRTQRRIIYFFSVFFPLCPLCLCGSFSSEPQRRPNIVFILADDKD
jgi:hypothetical protein